MGRGPLLPTFTCKFEGKLWSSGGTHALSVRIRCACPHLQVTGGVRELPAWRAEYRAISGKTHLVEDGPIVPTNPGACACVVLSDSVRPWRDCSPPDWDSKPCVTTGTGKRDAELHSENPIAPGSSGRINVRKQAPHGIWRNQCKIRKVLEVT